MNCKKCKKELPEESLFCNYCGTKQITTPRKTIKRENGAGSVYKRADLKNKPWIAATPYNNHHRNIIGRYNTAQEAKDALDDYRRNPTTKLNITVQQLYDEWKPLGYKDKSRQLKDSYNAAWKHLAPIYNIKFRELRTAQVQIIIENLQNERPKLDKDGKQVIRENKLVMHKPLGHSSLSKIKILLGILYQYAMENDIVNKNYAEFLVLPKNTTGVKDCFNDIELNKIEKAAEKGVPFADCILIMCYTGFRITEFLSLDKFSYKNNSLVGGIKTDAGKNRPVPIHPKIQNYIDIWKEKNGETIICNSEGKHYTSKYFREKCYYPALKQIGLRRLTPHATRRTFATRAAAAGLRPEDIEKLMGHTDYKIDVDSYINQSLDTLKNAIYKIP